MKGGLSAGSATPSPAPPLRKRGITLTKRENGRNRFALCTWRINGPDESQATDSKIHWLKTRLIIHGFYIIGVLFKPFHVPVLSQFVTGRYFPDGMMRASRGRRVSNPFLSPAGARRRGRRGLAQFTETAAVAVPAGKGVSRRQEAAGPFRLGCRAWDTGGGRRVQEGTEGFRPAGTRSGPAR